MSRVLVTGATGFAGQHLIDCLAPDYSVIGLASPNSKPSSHSGVKYMSGDVADESVVHGILAKHKPEFIVHLAAQTTAWFKNPTQVFTTNVLGTINLYKAIATLRAREGYSPKILYISSSEAYGKTLNPDHITEDAPFFPVNHYASSKASADRVSYEYSQSHKLNIIILRAFTHTGPGQRLGFFVPDMASQIAHIEGDSARSELLVGNLDATRDYLDVRDVVRAYRLVMEKDIPSGTALNVCSGKGIKVREVLEALLGCARTKIEVTADPNRMRPSDVPVFVGDNSRLRELTGWQPSIDLNDTLRETLDYWRTINNNDKEKAA